MVYGSGELDSLVLAYATTHPQVSGLRIPGRGPAADHAALSDAAEESPLYGPNARQEACRDRWAEEGRCHCGSECIGTQAMDEVARLDCFGLSN